MLRKYKYKLFGRFKGRKKILSNEFDCINKYRVNIDLDIKKNKYNILDIGSGNGENAIYLSNTYPKSKIIACDLYLDGNINLCNEIIKKNINNITLFDGNVLEFLDKLQKKDIFDEVWILFPDPWPKIRHHKRRLINNVFLNIIHSFLKKSGKLMIATDSNSYIESILSTIDASKKIFLWQNKKPVDNIYQNLELPNTKFYQKALKSNRNPMFFRLKKI